MTMKYTAVLLVGLVALTISAQQTEKPKRKITPGQAIVPTEAMRRIWGELVSLDLKTRTGTFRNETNDQVMSFTVLPYAELLHHAAFGDLQDFKVGERAIFRLHENDKGAWVWLTYIQDEMNFLNGHKEFYHIDKIDAAGKKLEITQASADKSFVRTKGITLEMDPQTRYWKKGQPATFADIQKGDKLQTKTHGLGKGQRRVCWEVFLDVESLEKFRDEQRAVLSKRMKSEGLPGYVDRNEKGRVELTLFQEAREETKSLKKGQAVSLAATGPDRAATGAKFTGKLESLTPIGNLTKVAVTLDSPSEVLRVTGVARLWPGQ
jgi:hypothetical protein